MHSAPDRGRRGNGKAAQMFWSRQDGGRMKPLVSILGAAAAGATASAAPEPVERAGAPPSAVAAAVRGRTAGPPVSCISRVGLRSTRAIAGALVFEGRGGVLYVNEGVAGCGALAFGRAIRTAGPTARLCRGDIVTAFEPVSGMEFGGCALGEFVPYRRRAR
jgi:hypothetical protein